MISRTLGSAGVALLAAAALAAPASADVVFGSAQVNSNALASATYGANGMGNGNGSNSDSASTFTPSLDASSYANGAVTGPGFTLEAQGQALEDASATFSSPSAGTIDFSGEVLADVVGAGGTAQGQDDGEYYNYDFTVTSESLFNLTYAYVESYLSVNNSYILIDNTTGTVISQLNGHGNTSGGVNLTLDPGSYVLGASTEYGDFAYQSGPGQATGSHSEIYNFDITAASGAPEPASWALMALGVGFVGLAMRRALGQRNASALTAA